MSTNFFLDNKITSYYLSLKFSNESYNKIPLVKFESHPCQNLSDEEKKLVLEKKNNEENEKKRKFHEINNKVTDAKGEKFTSDGPPILEDDDDILNNPELVWADVKWTKEHEEEALERLKAQSTSTSSIATNAKHYKEKAGKYWNEFYKNNKDHFYKDRHYIHIVFPELNIDYYNEVLLKKNIKHPLLLEVGCGVGNSIFPLLDVNIHLNGLAIDFAKSGVNIMNENKFKYDKIKEKELAENFENNTLNRNDYDETLYHQFYSSRLRGEYCNIIEDPIPLRPNEQCDFILCMFVLSAISIENQQNVFKKLFNACKPGGFLFIRDYAR